MDTSGDFRNADDFYGPQNMPGYTNLESNIVRALEIKETRALAIDSAARRVMSLLCYAWLVNWDFLFLYVIKFDQSKSIYT